MLLIGVLAALVLISGAPSSAEGLPAKDGNQELFDGSSETEGSDTKASLNDASIQGMFEIVTQIGTQKVFGGGIPLTVWIMPKIDSTKAEVVWDLPRGLETKDETDSWFTMVENTPRSFTITVVPSSLGKYVIVVDVTAWRYNTNYVASKEINITIDSKLHVSPAQPEYLENRTLCMVAAGIGVSLCGVLLVVGIKFGFRKYRAWMSAD